MFRFFKNLFNIGKKKDFMEVEIDVDKGRMVIHTNKVLSPEEIIEILEQHLGDRDVDL